MSGPLPPVLLTRRRRSIYLIPTTARDQPLQINYKQGVVCPAIIDWTRATCPEEVRITHLPINPLPKLLHKVKQAMYLRTDDWNIDPHQFDLHAQDVNRAILTPTSATL